MERSVFQTRLNGYQSGEYETVREATTYLEVDVFTDSEKSADERAETREGVLEDDVFLDWLHQRDRFKPHLYPDGLEKISTLRLLIQKNVKQPTTFQANVLSLTPNNYQCMIDALNLPPHSVETTSVVGALFWWEASTPLADINERYIQIIYRKADLVTLERPHGFELLLYHNFTKRTTTGFYKGTKSSGIDEILDILRVSSRETLHPMLLPLLLLQRNVGPRQECHQRETRALLQRVERDLKAHMIRDIKTTEQDKDLKSLPMINAELIDCHGKVWKNPKASLEIMDNVQSLMEYIAKKIGWTLRINGTFSYRDQDLRFLRVHSNLQSRAKFVRQKLFGLESYSRTTLSRIDMQRTALHNLLLDRQNQTSLTIEKLTCRHNILLDRQNETALEIERRQQAEAHQKFLVSQSLGRNQMSLSLLGTIFLPGAFVAAIFSTTFFNFQAGPGDQIVSPHFWIFWAVTLPISAISLAMVGLLLLGGESRDKRVKDMPLSRL